MPSAAPPQAEAPPRTELEELQIRANQVTDDVSIYLPLEKHIWHAVILVTALIGLNEKYTKQINAFL